MQIPARVTIVDEEAFYKNSASTIPSFITNLTFAEGSKCEYIQDIAFTNCSALTSVDLSNATSLSSINGCAFEYCSSLTSVSLPESLNEIGNSAFWHCPSLRSINFPNNLSSIGNSAFCDCSSLTSVTFPSSLESIGMFAFGECSNLSSITWDAWNGNITLIESTPFSGVCPEGGTVTVTNPSGHDSDELLQYLLDNGGLPSSWWRGPELPESVYRIENNVLMGFKSGINLSKFEDTCDTMQIPASVTSINESAFSYYSYSSSGWQSTIPPFIKNLTFAEGSQCITIGGYAFRGCSSLTSVVFPSSLTEFNGQYAFSDCTALTSVDLSNCSNMSSIYTHAFSRCSSLSTVKFPPNLTTIDSFAFTDYTSLTTINLPQSLEFIDDSFSRTGLISLDLSNCINLTSLDSYSFGGNEYLVSVTLPKNLTNISHFCFKECPSLSYIAWDLPTDYQTKIEFGSYVFDEISSSGTVKSLNPSITSEQKLDWLKTKCSWISKNAWTAAS